MATLTPSLSASQSTDCRTLTFTDTTEYPYPHNKDYIVGRNIVVYDNCNNIVSTGSIAQSFCLGLSGLPAVGDVYTIVLNGCTYSYTVTGEDIEVPNSVPWSSTVSLTQTGTVGTPNTFQINAGTPISVTTFLQSNVQLTIQFAVTAINNAITAAGYDNTQFYASGSNSQLTLTLNYYYASAVFGVSAINGFSSFNFTALNGLTPSPIPAQYAGGLPGSVTPEQAEIITQQTVLKNICQALSSGCDCTNAIISCNPCAVTEPCQVSITAAYPGVALDIELESSSESSGLTLTEITQNVTNMQLPSSTISNANDYTVNLTGDGVYCARLTLYEIMPAQCYYDIGPITWVGETDPSVGSYFAVGFSYAGEIDGVDLTGGFAVYPTWQGSIIATVNHAVSLFNNAVSILGVTQGALRAIRVGTSIRIILSSQYDCEIATFLAGNPANNVDPFSFPLDWRFGGQEAVEQVGATGSIPAEANTYETQGCFAVTCNIECVLANRLYKNLATKCNTPNEWAYTYELEGRLNAINTAMCEGDINGAKDLIFDTINLIGPSNCKQCQTC